MGVWTEKEKRKNLNLLCLTAAKIVPFIAHRSNQQHTFCLTVSASDLPKGQHLVLGVWVGMGQSFGLRKVLYLAVGVGGGGREEKVDSAHISPLPLASPPPHTHTAWQWPVQLHSPYCSYNWTTKKSAYYFCQLRVFIYPLLTWRGHIAPGSNNAAQRSLPQQY